MDNKEAFRRCIVNQIIKDIDTITSFLHGESKRSRVSSNALNQLHTIGRTLQRGMMASLTIPCVESADHEAALTDVQVALSDMLGETDCEFALEAVCKLCNIPSNTLEFGTESDLTNSVDKVFQFRDISMCSPIKPVKENLSHLKQAFNQQINKSKTAMSKVKYYKSEENLLFACGLTSDVSELYQYQEERHELSGAVPYNVTISDVNISHGLRECKMKKYYMVMSIVDDKNVSRSDRDVHIDQNNVLFPIRYYQDLLAWDETRIVQSQVCTISKCEVRSVIYFCSFIVLYVELSWESTDDQSYGKKIHGKYYQVN